MKCTKCGREAPPSRRSCLYCGGAIDESFEDKVITCPGCTHPMKKIVVADVTIDVCSDCGGIWLDRGELEELLQKRPKVEKKGEEELEEASRGQHYLSCPRCSKMMQLKNYKRCSGVLIDVCGKHGCYLDAGEFEQIVMFVEGGGLEKSAERAHEERKARKSIHRKPNHLNNMKVLRKNRNLVFELFDSLTSFLF